jgi:hypothetical protein
MLVPLVMQAANQGKLVGQLRQSRQVLVDLQAGDVGADRVERPAILGRSVRLQVKQVNVAGAAIGPKQDDRKLVPGIWRGRLGSQQAGQARQAGRQRTEAEAADRQPRAAIDGSGACSRFEVHRPPPTRRKWFRVLSA